ncbi:MAG: hypothetical protein ACREK6_14960 [Candidatus Rokuibacteriota bacterium]
MKLEQITAKLLTGCPCARYRAAQSLLAVGEENREFAQKLDRERREHLAATLPEVGCPTKQKLWDAWVEIPDDGDPTGRLRHVEDQLNVLRLGVCEHEEAAMRRLLECLAAEVVDVRPCGCWWRRGQGKTTPAPTCRGSDDHPDLLRHTDARRARLKQRRNR